MATGSAESEFLAHLSAELRETYALLPDLGERLGRAVNEGRAAWPAIHLEASRFFEHLARHAPADITPAEALSRLRAADLWLALGCALGDRAALVAFAECFEPDLVAILRRFQGPSLCEEDLRQALNEKLFVGGKAGRAKIAEYAGQGFLQNWVRITAVRTSIDLLRASQRTPVSTDEELLELCGDDDLELSFLKKHYRAEFKQAFEDAVTSLESADRNLLRQSVLRGLGIDQIAALHGIHRATAARRLERAREALLVATRKNLMSRLSIDSAEFESLMDLIRSQLDVSIQRILGSQAEGG